MKEVIWSTVNDECLMHVPVLSRYFKIQEFCLVDEHDNPVLYFDHIYYYKSGKDFYPILNNKTWFGDYYNHAGELVLTSVDKIRLIRGIRKNSEMYTFNINNNVFIINQVLKILADYVLDYYDSVRAYEQDNSYRRTIANFNNDYANLFYTGDKYDREDSMSEIGLKVTRVAPKLIEFISEYAAVPDYGYSIIEIAVDSGVLTVFKTGDWRIEQWKILSKKYSYKSIKSDPMPEADREVCNIKQSLLTDSTTYTAFDINDMRSDQAKELNKLRNDKLIRVDPVIEESGDQENKSVLRGQNYRIYRL